MWTDKIRKMKYVGATVRYLKTVNEKLVMHTKAMTLKAMDPEEEKNGDNAHRLVIEILSDYDLYVDLDKIVFVSDRGPDLKAALIGYKRYYCMAHMLNNIVAHASVPIENLISEVSKVVKYFKLNGLNTVLSTNLMSFVSTRWNTRYDMFESFIKVYAEIEKLIKPKDKLAKFQAIDLEEVTAVTAYLKTYKLLTMEVEYDNDITFVKILPCLETLNTMNAYGKFILKISMNIIIH